MTRRAGLGWTALSATVGLVVAVSIAGVAAAAPPRACAVLPRAVVAALIDEQARILDDTQYVCRLGRVSERAATGKTTATVLVVTNPSVAAAEKVQATTAKLLPERAPAGVSGFVRQDVPASGGKAVFVYWYAPGSGNRQTITNAQAYLQIGVSIVQLTFDVSSKGGPSFAADEIRQALPAVVRRVAKGS